MQSMIIIDENKEIITFIKKVVDENLKECIVAGEAYDAQTGKEMINLFNPEIILADIDIAKEIIPNIKTDAKIVLIAENIDKENINVLVSKNVANVLFKPLEEKCTRNIINNLIKTIEDEKIEYLRNNNQRAYCLNHLPYIRQKLLFDLILGNTEMESEKIKEQLDSYFLEIDNFYILLFSMQLEEEMDDKLINRIQYSMSKILQRLTDGVVNSYHVFIDMRKLVIIFNDELEYFTEKRLYGFCTQVIEEITSKYPSIYINVIVSSRGVDFNDVNEKYEKCLSELLKIRRVKTNSVVSFSTNKTLKNNQNQRQTMIAFRNNLISSLDRRDFESAEYYLSKITEESENIDESEQNFVTRYYTHIMMYINDIRRELNNSDDFSDLDIFNIDSMIKACKNIRDLNDILVISVNDVIKKMKGVEASGFSKNMEKAIEFIDKNYQNSISLEDVAAHIYLSPVHTSRIFNKEMGKTIITYINELRLKKAKMLLGTGNFKINEVAQQVGFSDARYFSTIFKKYEDMTPTEYLKKQKSN